MASRKNFQSKSAKHDNDRYDIYEPQFESSVKSLNENFNLIKKHINSWVEFCSFIRWMPDLYYDLISPSEGKRINFDLYQRVMMRSLSRFFKNYFCMPRGSAKTLIEVMVLYHTAICYPAIKLSITASTKESSVKIWKEKHDEIIINYPDIKSEFKSVNFAKDTGRVEFQNGSIIDNLANAQTSKGLRRHRGSLEESALIDKDLYEDAIEPIFNVPRTTMTGIIDPAELNGQINRFSTSGYKNSDEFNKIIEMTKEIVDCKGTFVFGSDWFLPVYFNRLSKAVIDSARKGNIIRFNQNYLCKWIGVSDGGLINISKLIKARSLSLPELECPLDKSGKLDLCEYIMTVDVARSASESNNKTSIVVLKIIRGSSGSVRQIQTVNIYNPPNGLNFEEQSIIIKRMFYQYGGNLDINKSRVKAIVIDANITGQGVVEKLLEEQTDFETNKELGCFATMNTVDKAKIKDAPKIVYALKSQGINVDIIRTFIGYVEANKLKLIKPFDDIKDNLPSNIDKILVEAACFQTQQFIDEVANLKIRKTQTTIVVEPLLKKIDKDRYSAISYGLYYISLFLDKEDIEEDDVSGFTKLMGKGSAK